MQTLVQRTAEAVLGQVNPYVLAVYFSDGKDQDKAIDICRKLIENEATSRLYKISAINLWGNALQAQGNNGDAKKLFKKASQLP